jgi:hypothetical protein
VVPPEELVDPPEDPPDEDVDPPDDEVDPPDDEVELLVLLVLLVLPPELDVDGEGSVASSAGSGSVPSVADARSDDGLPKSSLSFAPPHATKRPNDEAIAALMKRWVFMRVAKH